MGAPLRMGLIMNFLFHLYLSGNDPQLLTGNLMGDFVKGRIGDDYPPRLRSGILLHRRIDSFAQNHPLFRRSRQRIDPCFGLWRGVLVDMFYDHLLANEWQNWSPEPLQLYLARARGMVEANRAHLPERLASLVPLIFETLLPSYAYLEGVARALERMSARVRRPNPLAGGAPELEKNLTGLKDDFREFVPQVQRDVCRFLEEWSSDYRI